LRIARKRRRRSVQFIFFSRDGYSIALTAISAIGKPRQFLVIPAETGIFSIVPEKCLAGTENGEANQALAGQFP
jgi:hypothetical protein